MRTSLIHAGSESHILYIARVSSNQENTDPGLLAYLIRQNHWSPFEMVGACVEIETTRDIGRQILRHRSFAFQEFSQRYAVVADGQVSRDMRRKGSSNRQGSTTELDRQAQVAGALHAANGFKLYDEMIAAGVAPECARSVLSEGYATTRMYMNGTLRSWIHYLRERCKLNSDGQPLAQREHYDLARQIEGLIASHYPIVFEALSAIDYIDQEEPE